MKDCWATHLRLGYGVASETTRPQDNMPGEHMRPRVFYSAPSLNSRENGTSVEARACPEHAERMPAANTQSARPPCSHGPMGRLLRQESRQNGSQSRGYRAVFTPEQRGRSGGFTLVELAVSVGVLVVIVFLATQLVKSAATVTTLGHKQIDADSQARQLLDGMAIDLAQMVKRSDLDLFAKGTAAPNSVGGAMDGTDGNPRNDRIAFFSAVPGYYPPTGSQSPVSLVAYRVNSNSASSSYNKLERLGKGLLWNAVSSADKSVVFMPLTIGPSIAVPLGTWPAAVSTSTSDPDGNYEVIGPQVFRFEYYYLLKGQTDPTTSTTYSSILTGIPWDTRIASCCSTAASTLCCHTAPQGMRDVAAIVAAIAVIDPKSRVLVSDAQLATLSSALIDYGASAAPGCPSPNWQAPGELLRQWRCVLDSTNGLPKPAISGIRLYERYFYLSPPTLLTP